MRSAARFWIALVALVALLALPTSGCAAADAPADGPAGAPGAPAVADAGPPNDAALPKGAELPAVASRPQLRLLFIGNSYTYVYDVPGILRRIAATAGTGPTVLTEQIVVGGATLQRHL